MKTFKFKAISTVFAALVFCGAATVQAQAPAGAEPAPAVAVPQVSPPAAEVVKLASSGVGDEVVLAYIRNSQAIFDLNADQLLYLKDVGLSPQVITSMLDHDNAIKSQTQPTAPPPQEQPTAPAPQPQYAPQAPQPAPATQYAQPASATVPAPAPVASAVPPPTYVGSAPLEVSYFYNDLSPYGSWVDLAGVGWCWQPSAVVVTPGWRPYCNGGRWVWTDAGWFWQSDYSWGWAPFHYGRWYMDNRCGWVWLPGTTWGPAWVTWRTVGTTCGWAPLPPHADFVAGAGWRYNGVSVGASFDFGLGVNAFAFVSFGNFCSPNVSTYCLPRSQATVIYKQTTIVNNYVVNNNTFINRGVAYDRIAAASHAPIPRATVRETAGGKPAGGSGFVYREPLHKPAKPVNMMAQKVDMGHSIQHTSINSLKTEPKGIPSVGNGSTTSFFQHNNQNSTAKGQQNTPVGNRSSVQTENAGKNPTDNFGKNQAGVGKTPAGTGKNYQLQGAEKNLSNQQNPTGAGAGNKSFQPYQSYQPTTGSKPTQHSTTTPGNGTTLSSQGASGKQDTSPKDQFNTPGRTSATMGSSPQNFGQTYQRQQNYHWYQPKSSEQASEIRSLPKTDAPKTVAPSSPSYGSPTYKAPTYNNSGSQQFKKGQNQ